MVRQQAIGPDLGAGAPRRLADQTTVEPIIRGAKEHRLAPIAALGDVVRQARHHHPSDPRHGNPSQRAPRPRKHHEPVAK